MKVNYDAATDTLTVIFRDGPVSETDEDKPGVILDYDDQGNLVSIELLARQPDKPAAPTLFDAIRRTTSPGSRG